MVGTSAILGGALGAPIRQQPGGAALHMRSDRTRRLRGDIDLLAEEGGQRRTAAAIRHVQELDAGGLLEHLERHMRRAVVAGRAEGDLARALLGVGDEIGDRSSRASRCARTARPDRPARGRSARADRVRRRACGRRAARPPAGTSSTTAPSGACGRRARRAPPPRCRACRRRRRGCRPRPTCRGFFPAPAPPAAPRDRPARPAGTPRSW